MFFDIDKSGNTGLNFFDERQPRLSYGVLSSKLNVDAIATTIHKKMLKTLGVDSLHATDLRAEGLDQIADELLLLHRKCKFRFDYYFIDKRDFALVLFFDAVFDAGLNAAVKWELYWTPLRYLALQKLNYILDVDLLKESLDLCLTRKNRIEREEERIVSLLRVVRDRIVGSSMDARSKELLVDALDWGIRFPLALDFGTPDSKLVSPNTVGFQFVVRAIARRSRNRGKHEPTVIRVDQQQQFNKLQEKTFSIYSIMSDSFKNREGPDNEWFFNHPIHWDMSNEDIALKGLPKSDIDFHLSKNTVGIQIVDIYLWIVNQVLQDRMLPESLARFANTWIRNVTIDGISIQGMANRFLEFEKQLPKLEDMPEEQWVMAHDNITQHRDKVNGLFSEE